MSFQCDSCGLCCRNLHKIPALRHMDTGNGTCMHLVDNRCDIYADRPPECRVDEWHATHRTGMTLEEWHLLQERACRALKEQHAAYH